MQNHYEAILFDFDGVLADSEPVHYECWRELMIPFGIYLNWPEYQKTCIGVAESVMIEQLRHQVSPPIEFDVLWRLYPRKKEIFAAKMRAGRPVRDETIELITSLQNYKLAVVSSSGRTEVEPPLVQAGIRPFFEALVCGRELVQNLKPAPDPYLKAAELLGVTRALVVEDSDAGVTSGEAAGFDVLRITAPDAVAHELRERLGM